MVSKLLPEDLAPLCRVPVGLTVTLAGAMAAPHVLYAFIWEYPKRFSEASTRWPLKILGAHPVPVLGKLVLGLKSVQFASVLAWCEWGLLPTCGGFGPSGGWAVVHAVRSAAQARLSLAFGLLFSGQLLNFGIYRAIGMDGVYYGVKLGRPVPWATGFPFNLGLRHPQFVGAMLSWAGLFTLLAATPFTAAPLALVLLGWGGLYTATALHEASTDADILPQ